MDPPFRSPVPFCSAASAAAAGAVRARSGLERAFACAAARTIGGGGPRGEVRAAGRGHASSGWRPDVRFTPALDGDALMRVLGIETTCDETAASVVAAGHDGRGEVLSNEVLSQIAEHAAYGGVVPEIAARAHVEVVDRLVVRALKNAGTSIDEIDGIAAAAGPGLIGGVLVGLTTAKALALVTRKPLMAVNHLEGHALTARLTDGIGFPYLLLLVSGGHTQLLAVKGVGDYVRLGTTVDDAIGEAFDKVAKLLGLPYPGGPE